jgi:DDE superfamily endonuclease/Helix-turn-helix of DDE superfamily endonuclease
VTQDVLGCWFGVHRATISRAITEIRPILAERGCTVGPGIRLRTLADVVAYLGARPQVALIDATEVRVRRPAAHKPGRKRFVSGKARANTVKALVITGHTGRLLFCGEVRPGSIHDLTQLRQAGLVDLLDQAGDLEFLADRGYQGLGAQTRGKVITPRPKRQARQAPLPAETAAVHELERHHHSSRRIRVEHGIGHVKNWRALGRHYGRREVIDETIRAAAGLASSQAHAHRCDQVHRPIAALPAGPTA